LSVLLLFTASDYPFVLSFLNRQYKEINRNCKSKKDRQYKGQQKKDKQRYTKHNTENYRLSSINLSKIHRVNISCSTSDTETNVGINEKTQSKTIIILHFMTKKQLSFKF
jgi:hypothetical protein